MRVNILYVFSTSNIKLFKPRYFNFYQSFILYIFYLTLVVL